MRGEVRDLVGGEAVVGEHRAGVLADGRSRTARADIGAADAEGGGDHLVRDAGTTDLDYARLALQARADASSSLLSLRELDGLASTTAVREAVTTIFANEAEGAGLLTLHRAKGLERSRVFLSRPDLLPHPAAKLPWEGIQEQNLKYIAYTRSTNLLVICEGELAAPDSIAQK